MSSASQILKDIRAELESNFIEDEFVVRGRSFKMKILNDYETGWVYSNSSTKSELGLAVTVRRATLAIGVRSIDGETPESLFKDIMDTRTDDEKASLLKASNDSSQELHANLMLEFLNDLTTDYINELYDAWTKLEERRKEAQGNLKN